MNVSSLAENEKFVYLPKNRVGRYQPQNKRQANLYVITEMIVVRNVHDGNVFVFPCGTKVPHGTYSPSIVEGVPTGRGSNMDFYPL